MYPFYEKAVKAGIKNVCIHKGLFAPAVEEKFPRLRPYADVSDVGKAAKDWPQLNFLIYHSGYRWVGATPAEAMAEFDQTGRTSWTSDLAEIPEKYGVTNVYGDLGQLFAWTAVAEPRLAAALMGMLVKGLGADHVAVGHRRGVDRRAAMADRGAAPARDPGGHAEEIRLQAAWVRPTARSRTRIFGGNTARLYNFDKQRRPRPVRPLRRDQGRLCEERAGPQQSALRLRPQFGLKARHGRHCRLVMKLDARSFASSVRRLREGLARCERESADEQLRDGRIQRFEFTFELSHKMLRRYLKETVASPDEFERMPFADLIRSGSAHGLLRADWPAWRRFREMRGRTSHTYDAQAALAVVSAIPEFLEEAEHLCDELERRLK